MKIAMIGHKDFPCRSGGVEVVVYELSRRLAEKGESITVYNRGRIKKHNKYMELGVNVVRCFTFKKQSLNAMVYSFTATFKAMLQKFDIIHYHAIGPSVPLILPHIFGIKTVATIHGLNWRVDKWNSFASKYLKLGERIAAKYADEVITLSEEMQQYFLKTYGRKTTLIKNGITPIPRTEDGIIQEKFGIKAREYILYIGRISPEKGVLDLVKAFKRANTDKKLVLAGEFSRDEYSKDVLDNIAEDKNIICTGFVSGEVMHSLYSNCCMYVLPSHTEGLPLTLLEAMSCGANCLVSDIYENTSVLGKYGNSFKAFDIEDLAFGIEKYSRLSKSEAEIAEQMEYIRKNYGYERVIEEHLKAYHRVMKK